MSRKAGNEMIVKKHIIIVADIICDEDFDCNQLLIAQDIGDDVVLETPPLYVGRGEDGEWEVARYIFQDDVTLSDEVV